MADVNPPDLNKNPPAASQCPSGGCRPPMCSGLGGGRKELASGLDGQEFGEWSWGGGLWSPGLPPILGFYELPGFITNSLHTAKALPGSLCRFKL